jgi:DNA-directed RNA polymerase specialized sigma24 family protein
VGAAEVLGLPLSTYKRHLKRAVERVADDLWERRDDLK